MSIHRRSRRRGLPARFTADGFLPRLACGRSPICVAIDSKSSERQLCRTSNAVATACAHWRGGMFCGSPMSRTNVSSMESSSSNTSRSLRFQRSPAARFANTSSEAERDRSNGSVLSARARRLSGTVGVTVIPILVTSAVMRGLHSRCASRLSAYRTYRRPSADIGFAVQRLFRASGVRIRLTLTPLRD